MPLDDAQQRSTEQFGRQSHRYGKGHILADVADLESALRSVDLPQNAVAIDIATGGGHAALFLARQGFQVTAADLARPMLDRTREAAEAEGLSIETRQHAAEDFPYPADSVDLVTCRFAAHHFSSPATFVRESARILKPGGVFLVIDGSVDDDRPVAEKWIHDVEKLRDPSHGRFLTPNTWRELCLDAGLTPLNADLDPMKQPDVEWYFETAATPEANRIEVRNLIRNAPPEAVDTFGLTTEDGKTVWWWKRITLLANKSTWRTKSSPL